MIVESSVAGDRVAVDVIERPGERHGHPGDAVAQVGQSARMRAA